jgi:hypothetical protein
MNSLLLQLDNPIFVKHCRSRLRRMHLLPSLAITAVLALSIVVIAYQFNKISGGRLAGGGEMFGALMILQSVILGAMGASQIGTSVAKARESGILDFHRVTPMSKLSMVLGFFFGAPVREYLMFAVTLPFSIACVVMGTPSIAGAFQLLVPLVLGAWVMHAIAMLNALAGKSGKTGSGARGIVGMLIFLVFGGGWLMSRLLFAAKAVDEFPTSTIYSIDLPWLVILAIDLFPVIGFFLVASTRKMASDRAHTLSKPQAIGCLATAAFLILGGLWGIGSQNWTFVVLFVLILGAIILSSAMTPGLDEFSKGIRQAAKEGRKYPATWSDRGLNRLSVFCLAGVVLIASTVCWYFIENAESGGPPIDYSLPIAIGVLVVAYNGLALQFFLLRFGKRGPTYYALFLFTALLVPLVCGVIASLVAAQNSSRNGSSDTWPIAITSLSPIAGIITSSGVMRDPDRLTAVRACALVPALVFALLFNNLVTTARRRIERQIHPETTKQSEPDVLAEPVLMG